MGDDSLMRLATYASGSACHFPMSLPPIYTPIPQCCTILLQAIRSRRLYKGDVLNSISTMGQRHPRPCPWLLAMASRGARPNLECHANFMLPAPCHRTPCKKPFPPLEIIRLPLVALWFPLDAQKNEEKGQQKATRSPEKIKTKESVELLVRLISPHTPEVGRHLAPPRNRRSGSSHHIRGGRSRQPSS